MNDPSRIDVDSATVTRTVTIDAPRDLVWATLTAPDQVNQWFGQTAEFPDGVHLGAVGVFGWRDHGDFPARIDEWQPTARFAFTWGVPGEEIRPDNSTTATFTLEDGDLHGRPSTVLTVTETGFDRLSADATERRAAMEDNAQGWIEELDELITHVGRVLGDAPTRPDPQAGTVTRTVLVRADRATVWEALIDPAAIEEWWGHPAVFPDGVRAGASGTFESVGHGLMPIRVQRLDPPERQFPKFQLRWGGLGESEPGPTASLVTFTLTSAGEHTLLTVVETGFAGLEPTARRAAIEDTVDGWTPECCAPWWDTVLASFRGFVAGVSA